MATIFEENFPQVLQLQEETDQAKYIIGLDLHKKTTAIAVVDTANPQKAIYQRKRIKNENVIETIQQFSGKKTIVAESSYGWVLMQEALSNIENITFVIFDPRKTSSWVETVGIKSDKIDSEILAYACLKGGLARLAVHQSTREARENFKLVNLRDKLVKQQTSVKNQLNILQRENGTNPYTGKVISKSEITKEMEDLLLDQISFLKKKIKIIEEQMVKISKCDEVIPLLNKISGIGKITAFALRYKIEDIGRFKNAKKLASYFGFAIRQSQSGESMRKGKISKTGNVLIRKLLVQGAQVVRNSHPEYLELFFPNLGKEQYMKDKRHANKTVIALARKQLTFVYKSWTTMEAFNMEAYKKMREKEDNSYTKIKK